MPIPVSPATSGRTANRLAGRRKLHCAPELDDNKADEPTGRLTPGAWWAGRDASPGLSPGPGPGPDRGLWVKVGVAIEVDVELFEVVIGFEVEFVPSTA
jgi:hypothetical protein